MSWHVTYLSRRQQDMLADLLVRRGVRQPDGCIQYPKRPTKNGYILLRVGGGFRLAHRLAYELFVGYLPSGALARHTCDNPACHNPSHLIPGTHQDNKNDSVSKGRHAHGEKIGRRMRGDQHPNIKMTDAEVIEARAKWATGRFLVRELAATYHVSENHMRQILKGRVRETAGATGIPVAPSTIDDGQFITPRLRNIPLPGCE